MKEEFIILLQKFLHENITIEEQKRFHQLYEKLNVDEYVLSDYYQKEWEKAFTSDMDQYSKQDEEIAWKEIHKHVINKPLPVLASWRKGRLIAAAVVFAVLFTGLGYFFNSFENNNGKDLIVTVENGQKAQVDLPDGSKVWLNAASRLSYTSSFNRKDRIVKLIGEACFDVKKDPEKTFIVQTSDGLFIKALGTKFNVKSYPEDEYTISTLLEGKIQISNAQVSNILRPNEKLIFNRKNSAFTKKEIKEQETIISWINDRLAFEEETLGSIVNTLKRLYDIEVIVESDQLNHIIYSGKIKDNNLENILKLITTVSPVQYTLKENVVTFQEQSHKPD